MKEEFKKDKKELVGVTEQVKVIRDSIAHNSFSIDENGYYFENDKKKISMTYDEFTQFLHKVENEFYKEKFSK